jgi:hypothetical protein
MTGRGVSRGENEKCTREQKQVVSLADYCTVLYRVKTVYVTTLRYLLLLRVI